MRTTTTLILTLALAGCAASQDDADRRAQTPARPNDETPAAEQANDAAAPDEQPSADDEAARARAAGPPVEPVREDPVEQVAATGEGEGAQAPPAEEPREEEPEPDEADATLDPPSWWRDDPVREGDVLRVCAQAPGENVLAARRAAVDAGRERLQRELGRDVIGERVTAATVLPLPAVGASRTAKRYVGYVMVEVETD